MSTPVFPIEEKNAIVFLGTAGGPGLVAGRTGIATALVAGGEVHLIDAGRGMLTQYVNAGLELSRLRSILVTHLHGDHVADLFNVFMLGAGALGVVEVLGPGRGRPEPYQRLSPPIGKVANSGLHDLFEASFDAQAATLNMWGPLIGDVRDVLRVVEIGPGSASEPVSNTPKGADSRAAPFPVLETDRVRITATTVEHMSYSLAFRVDTDHGSVVFSGDTGPCQNLIELARGADVLVHEVMDLEAMVGLGMPPIVQAHFPRIHTDVNAVGRIAAAAGVRTLVLNHFVPADPALVAEERWQRGAQAEYDGRVIVARDMAWLDASDPRANLIPLP